ncbi:uncharacterized protein [Aristolochia californica]|uniref:uncharacterized protein n=1 Tax=Aristolochia californica TaxID=171875 RepID=UPI0035DC0CDC
MKRVRFSEPGGVPMKIVNSDASSMPAEVSFQGACGAVGEPKTTEYKNFKKMREKMGHDVHCRLPDKQDFSFEVFETHGGMRELSSRVHQMNRMSIPTLSEKHVLSSKICKASSCERGSGLQVWGPLVLDDDMQSIEVVPRLLTVHENDLENDLKFPRQTSGLSSKVGKFEDDFVRKRHRLLQLAAETLCIKEHQLSARGELVSAFLQRLGVDNKSNFDRIHHKSSEAKLKTGFRSSDYPFVLPGASRMDFEENSPSDLLKSGLLKCYDEPDKFSLSADHRTEASLSVICTHSPVIQQKSWDPVTSGLGSIDMYLKSDDSDVNLPGDFLFNRCGSPSVVNLPLYDCSILRMLPAEQNYVREKFTLPLLSWNEVAETEPVLSVVPYYSERNPNSMRTLTNHQVDERVSCSPSNVPISYSSIFDSSREPFPDAHLFASEFEEFGEFFESPLCSTSTEGDVLRNGYRSNNSAANEFNFIGEDFQTEYRI